MSISAKTKRWRKIHRGLPLKLVMFNAMGSGARQDVKRSIRILNKAANVNNVDVLAGVETQLVPRNTLDRKEWAVRHRADDYHREGVFFAIRKSRGRIINTTWKLGTRNRLGSRRAVRMRERWIMIVDFVVDEKTPNEARYKIAVQHMPPKRNWFLWPIMATNMWRVKADIYAGDFNKLARAVAPALRRKAYMTHIVGFAVRKRYPVRGPHRIALGADHPGVAIVVWPKR